MQPPSKTPTLNSAKNKPLAAISSSFQLRRSGATFETVQAAINRKSCAIAMISGLSTSSLSKTVARMPHPTLDGARPLDRLKNDIALKTLTDGLPYRSA
jgi:hypothetical protein